MSENPAWPIPLTMEERVALGELVVIQGQIEHMMRLILDRTAYGDLSEHGGVPAFELVSISKASLGAAVDKWLKTLRQRFSQPDLLTKAGVLAGRILQHAERRNTFLHATYAHFPMHDGRRTGILFDVSESNRGIPGPVMAFRARDWDLRPVREIFAVRDEAAVLAREMRALKEEVWSQTAP